MFVPAPLNPKYNMYFVTAMLHLTSSSRSSTSSSLFHKMTLLVLAAFDFKLREIPAKHLFNMAYRLDK